MEKGLLAVPTLLSALECQQKKKLKLCLRKQLTDKATLLWRTRKNNPETSGFRFYRKPRKVAFHVISAFRTCKHIFSSSFQKESSCHHVACHCVHSYFSLLNNFGTYWPISESDREVDIWKTQTFHMVCENSSQIENLINALSEDKG